MGQPEEPSTELLPAAGEAQAQGIAHPQVTPEGQPEPTLIGRTLGRFTVVEKLGRGGSGEVFRAEQQQLGRSAVIKVLRREVAMAPNRVERFLREAKLASRLDHPYAAHIYAFGAETDNVLWIAMEHVKGVTLDDLVARRGAMPAQVFAPLFVRLCEVIHTAHELDIVHRDIKGANVMVIERAGQLLPKLLDFGIAKGDAFATTPGVVDGELTGHGVTLGSPHYMSPEQWERPADVDARSDIYALGVLAYRCLAGFLPFHTTSRLQLAHAHTHLPVPAMPDFVSPSLADVIMKALAKQPEQRWQTAVAFAEAVQRAVGTPVTEAVPLFDPATRDAWLSAGPQPIADAVAHVTSATTTVEVDAALRELVAITCRWLAVLSLSGLPPATGTDPSVREHARAVVGRDDGAPWLRLAKAAVAASPTPLMALVAALEASEPLAKLADRLDDPHRQRTAALLAADVGAAAEALSALEPLLAYHLVLGGAGAVAESWQGPRRRDREKVLVWGELAESEVALLDTAGKVVARLSPYAQVIAPLPAAEPELFLLWRSGRGQARLVAAPWGFERDDERAGTMLAALSTEDSDTAMDAQDERSPYPGLAAYGTADADHFVGREREVETLANRLVRAPLIAVLGPSGVGKSSFIHAGLVPRLGEQHRVLTMRPGRHPLHALAALPPVSGDSHDEGALVARLRELGESAQRGLVLVVDQLEEMVTLCADPDERRRFAETLAGAADGPNAPVRVVATLRDDFATVIESEAAFRGQFDVFVLATPPPESLRRIVVEPARRSAVSVDTRVVDDMVAEVAGRPASLPLLSFTASQLWQTRDRQARKITYDAYLELGGVAGALATYADQVYGSLARRDQETVRDVFARLVAANGTRVPSPRSDLEQLPGAKGVLGHLIDARLLVVRDVEGQDIVEIVHECLAERWPRLARWRSEDAADRALLADVTTASRRWIEAGRRADLLWRGEALAELSRLTARSTAMTGDERAFADAAVLAQTRARRIRRTLIAASMLVLAGVAIVMAYLSVVANENRAEAERSAKKAADAASLAEQRLTQSLIAQGRRELNDGRDMPALAYFAAALERGADTPALREMVSLAERGWPYFLTTHRGTAGGRAIVTMAGSPDGWIVGGDDSGSLRWWNDEGALIGELKTELQSITGIDRNPDNSLVVSGLRGIVIVDASHRIVQKLAIADEPWFARRGPGPDEVSALASDALRVYGLDGVERRSMPITRTGDTQEPMLDEGARHAIFAADGELSVVDLKTMKIRSLAHGIHNEPNGANDGSRYAYIDHDWNVHLLRGDGTEIKKIKPDTRPIRLVLSDDGTRLGITSEQRFDVFDEKGELLDGIPLKLEQASYAMRGDDVWVTNQEGTVRHYVEGQLVASAPLHASEIRLVLVARNALATVGSDSTLVMMKADARQVVEMPHLCKHISFAQYGVATGYTCGDTTLLYTGRKKLGEYPETMMMVQVMHEPAYDRTALAADRGIRVFDGDAKEIARTDKFLGAAWADRDHLWAVTDRKTLSRWAFATDTWEKIGEVPESSAVGSIPGYLLIGTEDGEVHVLVDGREQHVVAIGTPVVGFNASPDHRWVAAQLSSGAAAIISTTTWTLERTLAQGDANGDFPIFDATGDLVLRANHYALTIWDRATGEELVFGLDLLSDLGGGRWLPDGRIEMNRRRPSLLDIPRDKRPVPDILADIACHVPLKVVGSRIEPTVPIACAAGVSGLTLPK
ncbi:MAG TPA: serine/threonine-protein kinase [Kofleriaceae bacterium]|nr:serine/threonine-protein kinase [Kofleriaceae bacterium]